VWLPFRPQLRRLFRVQPELAIQNPSNSASGDGAIGGCPRLHQEVDQHFCRDDHQEGDDGAEQYESRDSRSCSPIRTLLIERPRSRTDEGNIASASVNGLLTAAEPFPLPHPH
jgi:hypothetical protein